MLEQVVEVMRSALLSSSRKNHIELKNCRIKMQPTETKNSVNCILMNKVVWVQELSWTSILGMKVIFKGVIIETIYNSLLRIAKENNIETENINFRVFSVDDKGTPSVYLYDKGKAIKEIKINDIIN